MPISSINPHAKVNPTDVPLDKLATSKALTEEQKTSEMTRQFEAVLLRHILNEAQKPAFKSKYAATGVSTAIYQDLMVNQLADKTSSSRTDGLAQELEAQFPRQTHNPKAAQAALADAADVSQDKTNHAAPPIPLTKAPRL